MDPYNASCTRHQHPVGFASHGVRVDAAQMAYGHGKSGIFKQVFKRTWQGLTFSRGDRAVVRLDRSADLISRKQQLLFLGSLRLSALQIHKGGGAQCGDEQKDQRHQKNNAPLFWRHRLVMV